MENTAAAPASTPNKKGPSKLLILLISALILYFGGKYTYNLVSAGHPVVPSTAKVDSVKTKADTSKAVSRLKKDSLKRDSVKIH